MSEFNRPQPRRGGLPPLPETVPLARERDPVRKAVAEEFLAGVGKDAPPEVPPMDEPQEFAVETAPPPGPVVPDVSEEDKKEFLRSVLAGKPFRKIYTLFGSVAVEFEDRDAEATRQITEEMAGWALPMGPRDFDRIVDEFFMAATLKGLQAKGQKRQTWEFKADDSFQARVVVLRDSLARPLFLAVLEAARTFDAVVGYLISQAPNRSFWPGAGPISQ